MIFSKLALAALLVLAVFLSVKAGQVAFRAWEARQLRLEKEAQLAGLLAKERELEERISDLKNPDQAEREAKERFGVGREGERVIIITESRPAEEPPAPASAGGRFFEFFNEAFAKFFR